MDLNDTVSSITVYSDCDCYLCKYAMENQDPEGYPFCTDAINPVLYYAQCRHVKKEDCNACRRPNFFVRAFRWYTNERVVKDKWKSSKVPAEPCKDSRREQYNDGSCPQNVGAFATWLDSKYQQYLIESAAPDACRIMYSQTSVIESCNANQDDQLQSGPCGRKRFSRLKGYGKWKKKVQKCNEQEKFSERERTQSHTLSTEFIMAPKNLSRAASACCHPTPAGSADKHVAKSRSATATVTLNRSGYDSAEFAKPPVEQTCPKCKYKSLNNHNNASCQCISYTGQNAQTQYEPKSSSSKQDITSYPSAARARRTNKTRQRTICECSSPSVIYSEQQQYEAQKQQVQYPEVPNPCLNLQKPCPSKTQQQQVQYQETYPEVPKPCSCCQQALPSKTQRVLVKNQVIDTEVSKPCPSLLQPRSSKTQELKIQYQETYSEVPKPCPSFQQPCPSLGEPNPSEPCPSLRDPCVGRRTCPSLRKVCPPCPKYNSNICKESAEQTQQNGALKINSQQSYQQSIQIQQATLNSQSQNSDKKPTLRDICFAKQTNNCVRKQMPTFVEPGPRVGEMPLKQEEYSLRTYSANLYSGSKAAGPSTREASTETNTCSVQTQGTAQGTTLLYAHHQNSANCKCSDCSTNDKTVCCKKNEQQQPLSNQNVFITTSTGEGKCSVNCPFYASVSIKGQATQTSQTVQFSQSVDHTVQTSDTAIRLDRGTIPEYPLFMRVVCADKLQ